MRRFMARRDLRAGNLHDMMRICDVDPDRLVLDQCGRTTEMVARACFFCRYGETCRQWLDSAEGTTPEPPAFCPNAARFLRARPRRAG